MRIELTDKEQAPDLVRFLRARGCIAYQLGSSVIEALRPAASANQERAELNELLDIWLAAHPGASRRRAD